MTLFQQKAPSNGLITDGISYLNFLNTQNLLKSYTCLTLKHHLCLLQNVRLLSFGNVILFLHVVHREVTLEKELLVTKPFKDYLLPFLYRELTHRTIIPSFEN